MASLRINSILEAGAKPILISNKPSEKFPKSIQDNIAKGNLKHIEKEYGKWRSLEFRKK